MFSPLRCPKQPFQLYSISLKQTSKIYTNAPGLRDTTFQLARLLCRCTFWKSVLKAKKRRQLVSPSGSISLDAQTQWLTFFFSSLIPLYVLFPQTFFVFYFCNFSAKFLHTMNKTSFRYSVNSPSSIAPSSRYNATLWSTLLKQARSPFAPVNPVGLNGATEETTCVSHLFRGVCFLVLAHKAECH